MFAVLATFALGAKATKFSQAGFQIRQYRSRLNSDRSLPTAGSPHQVEDAAQGVHRVQCNLSFGACGLLPLYHTTPGWCLRILRTAQLEVVRQEALQAGKTPTKIQSSGEGLHGKLRRAS